MLFRSVGVFLAEMQLAGAHRCVMAVRAVAQKHREEASGKRVQDRQAGARLASGFTIGRRVELPLDEQMHDGQASARLARKCTMGEALYDGQAPPRQGNRWHIGLRAVARYFCLGGALRGYILSITSIGTPRIRCSCLFVAE